MTYGPIDFLALEFQNENLKGEILPALVDLIEQKIVRVIDLVIIQKYQDGTHAALEINQLSPDLLGVFDPLNAEVSGLIQEEDINNLAEVMRNETTAAALLFENLWAIKFKEAVLNAEGKVLEQVRLSHEDVEEALAKIASVEENK
ncbi:MAG TPA: DUF6325 family protein [Anaerolineales bacterium]|nr:DUF6325 family protein [Anaerolineales bacterium]